MRQINSNESSRAEVNRLAPSRAGHPFGKVCAWRTVGGVAGFYWSRRSSFDTGICANWICRRFTCLVH